MKTAAARRKKKGKPDSYFELVKQFPLVSIKTDQQLARASKFLDHLLGQSLDAGGERYLDALSDLVIVYEDAHVKFPSTSPASRLAFLIEDAKGCTQADVSRATGISQGNLSEILSGRRRIALSHLAPLAKFFHVPQSVFLEDT
jgi:antitoxin component HigA of HigAB toxin-antitoxin module